MTASAANERTTVSAQNPENRPLHVLVVEDDPSLRGIVVEALEGEGHAVRSTDDGAEALEWITKEPPDVVLLDMVMPQASVDGFEFIARLKTAPADVRDVPLVLLSALGPSLSAAIDARSASALNIVWVLAKPCDLSELISVTRAAGQGRGTRRT